MTAETAPPPGKIRAALAPILARWKTYGAAGAIGAVGIFNLSPLDVAHLGALFIAFGDYFTDLGEWVKLYPQITGGG